MARRHISQDEARALKSRCAELETVLNDQRNAWVREWPAGIHIAVVESVPEATLAAVNTARKLGHAVVATIINRGAIDLYAMPIGKAGE